MYVLDSNTIIILWEKHPEILHELENSKKVEYKILKNIAAELYPKEHSYYNELPVLSERFINLLPHVDETEITPELDCFNKNFEIKSMYDGRIYYVKDNKLSKNDFLLICYCSKNKEYILVTEDKKLLSSARNLLGNSKALNLQEFLYEICREGIII